MPAKSNSLLAWVRRVFRSEGEPRKWASAFKPRLELLEEKIAPATFNVTEPTDAGAGSLRQAVLDLVNANNADTANRIQFAQNLAPIELLTALPDITKNVQIVGTGQTVVTISANATESLRIFNITGSATDVQISGITISNGVARPGNISSGGGIRDNVSSGRLVMTNCVITACQATGGGGGLWVSGLASLTITGCQFNSNSAGTVGGGLFIAGQSSGGTVAVINNTYFELNVATVGGGAIVDGARYLQVSNRCVFEENRALNGNGGAIAVPVLLDATSVLWVRDATFTQNRAPNGRGGAVSNFGGVGGGISDSTFNGNTADTAGAIFDPARELNLVGNTMNLNSAMSNGRNDPLAGLGGAIFLGNGAGGVGRVSNSTFTDNSAAVGGAIYLQAGASALLTNDTIADNTASTGGGVYAQADANVSLGNTIIALNTDTAGTPDVSGVFESQGNNLIGNPTGSSGWITTGNGVDLLGGDPLLEPLGNYGGDTQTMPPMAGSPAIDAGSNALAVDAAGNPLATDQRGFARIVNGTVDIGAVEIQANEAGVATVSLGLSESPATFGDTVTLSATVTAAYSTSGTPTGSVAFYDGSSLLGTGTLVSGAASISVSTPTAGDHTITAVYSGDSTFNTQASDLSDLPVLQATPTIAWSNPADITVGTALGSAQLNAVPSVLGTLTYTPAAGTVLGVGAQQALTVNFAPADSVDYAPVTATVYINVYQTLLDQSDYDPANTQVGALESQVFDSAMSAYTSYSFVHYSVPSGGSTVNSVSTWVVAPAGVPEFTTAELVIAPQASGGGPDVANAAYDSTVAATFQVVGTSLYGNVYKVTLAGLNISLTGGDYYVAIAPVQNYSATGIQTYVLPEISQGLSTYDSWFYNPGGAFGYGTSPVTTDSLGYGSFTFAYQINGTTS
jgi:hypothetical protein